MNVRYCKNLLFLLLLILIVVSLSGCGNSNTKRFQEAVDDFCDAYTKYNSLQGIEYKSETDLINEDLSLRKMVSSLKTISEIYEDADNVRAYNDYLRFRIDYDKVEVAIQYDNEDGEQRITKQKLIEYLKDNR